MLQRTVISISPFALVLLVWTGLHAQDAAPPSQERPQDGPQDVQGTSGGLRRVEPDPNGAQVGATMRSSGADVFDPEQWIQRLDERNLDLREQNFEELVGLAKGDQEARRFLEELAQDGNLPDLAWTARLALRELERRPALGVAPFEGFFGPGQPGRLEELFPDFQVFQLDPDRLMPPGVRTWFQDSGATSEGRRVTVEETGEGCTIRITEERDGEEVNREYEGTNYEAILEANPELREELGEAGVGGMRIHFGDRSMNGFFGRMDPFGGGRENGMRFYVSKHGLSPQPMRTDILGVRVRPTPEAVGEQRGIEAGKGLWIDSVFPRTIAHALKLRSGDVLLKLGGQDVSSAEDITRILSERTKDANLAVSWVDATGVLHEASWSPQRSSDTSETENERRDF